MTRYFLLSKYTPDAGQMYLADYCTKTGNHTWLPLSQKSDADRFPEGLKDKLLRKDPTLMFEATTTICVVKAGGVE